MPTDTPTFHECRTTTSIKTPRQQTVPPETGATSEAEGVDKTNGKLKGENGKLKGENGKLKGEPTQEARAEAKCILIMPSNKEEKTTKSD